MKLAPGSEAPVATDVKIEKTTLRELLDDQNKLRALEAGGVDNWEGYDHSMQQAGLFTDDDEEDEGNA